jgi:general stress protein YciG
MRCDKADAALGRKGARERAKRLSPEQRKEIARKAGKASGSVRRKNAKGKN